MTENSWPYLLIPMYLAMMTIPMVFLVYQDYLGEGKAHLSDLRRVFRSKYRIYFRLGELRAQSLVGHQPTDDEALEMGMRLWVDGKRRTWRDISSLARIHVLDSRGNRRFIVVPGRKMPEEQACLIVMKVLNRRWGLFERKEIYSSRLLPPP